MSVGILENYTVMLLIHQGSSLARLKPCLEDALLETCCSLKKPDTGIR